MSTIGREVVGRCDYNMLIADNKHPLDVCHVIISAGAKHQKGEILEILENGYCNILGTTASGQTDLEETENVAESTDTLETSSTAAYILAEDVDAEEDNAVAAAYRSGSFVRNVLIVKEGYSLTDKDEAALRNGGIYLSDAII